MKLPSMRQATMDFQYVPKGPIRINQGQLHDYVICLFSGVDAFSCGATIDAKGVQKRLHIEGGVARVVQGPVPDRV
jgi:hypothetical protein